MWTIAVEDPSISMDCSDLDIVIDSLGWSKLKLSMCLRDDESCVSKSVLLGSVIEMRMANGRATGYLLMLVT